MLPNTHKSYISTVELAKLLGVSSVAVFKRIQKGQIKATKIGRSYAIPRSYVEEQFPEYKIQAPIEGEYLSVMEAAGILGISRVAVFKRIQSGKIPAKKIGRHYVIEKHEIVTPQEVSSELPPLEKEYFSIPEVAEILGKSRVAIFKQVQKGTIKARRVGRHFVIARADILGVSSPVRERQAVDKRYVSVSEAAQHWGISRVAVFKKIQKGQIVGKKMGRSYAIPIEELKKPVRGQRGPGGDKQ
ncbi:MAG: excisionase family DNA-binding protein [Candidatus Omnitrophica bacterium]|nr:excisionase family DNA-binding protein [Candidatus Omnitrophota bacterium]